MSDSSRGRQNQGYLYPNEKNNDRQPDYRGKLNVDGKEWLASGWIRQKDGQDMISVSLTDPATLPARGSASRQGGAQGGSGGQGPAGNQGGGTPPASGGQGGTLGDIFEGLPG